MNFISIDGITRTFDTVTGSMLDALAHHRKTLDGLIEMKDLDPLNPVPDYCIPIQRNFIRAYEDRLLQTTMATAELAMGWTRVGGPVTRTLADSSLHTIVRN